MSLTLKLSLSMAAAVCLVFGLNAALRIRREAGFFEDDMQRDHRALGTAVADATSLVWTNHGEKHALDIVRNADLRENNVDIRWVWLDVPAPTDGDAHGRAAEDDHRPIVEPSRLAGVRAGHDQAVRITEDGAESDTLVTYVAASVPGERRGAIEIRESLADKRAYLRRTIRDAAFVWAVLMALCTVLVVGLSVLFVTRPVRQLVVQAARIGRGELDSRVAVRRRDEIGKLAEAMNAMTAHLEEARERLTRETAARIATIEQLRHADRLMTVGKLAAGIAHEIGTPLNVITGHAQLIIEEGPAGSPVAENARVVTQQAQRVADIIRQLLDFARRRTPKPLVQDLRPFLRQTVSLLEALARKRGVDPELEEPAEEVSCAIDVAQLQQAVTNLIVNAIHASTAGPVRITTGRRSTTSPADHGGATGPHAFIDVHDRGSGIAPEVLPRIFEPFFTTKDVGEGTGLGLSVAYGIVKEHGGWIEVASEPGRGSCFSIYLPLEGAT